MSSIRRRAALSMSALAVSAVVVPVALSGPVSASPTTDVYDAIGDSPPPNVISLGFEATQTSEFGDRVTLGGTARGLDSVTVLMSSWGCESGGWNTNNCVTSSGASFNHELTLTLYNVDDSVSPAVPGSVIASMTKTFAIPYRPSASADCSGGRWKASDGNCYNGFATPVTFDFASGTTLPDDLIWGISYNTSHYGANPIGNGAPCYTASGGCGYDSLNVGAESLPGQPSAGTDGDEDVAYIAYGAGAFSAEDGWAGYRPLARIAVDDTYGFEGFRQPVNNGQLNIAKAGQSIPIAWRITDGGVPVSDPASFVSLKSIQIDCDDMASEGTDAIEEYSGGSGLIYQGDGNWQFNWKTPKLYAGQCRAMTVMLDDGTTHTAYFQFR